MTNTLFIYDPTSTGCILYIIKNNLVLVRGTIVHFFSIKFFVDYSYHIIDQFCIYLRGDRFRVFCLFVCLSLFLTEKTIIGKIS